MNWKHSFHQQYNKINVNPPDWYNYHVNEWLGVNKQSPHSMPSAAHTHAPWQKQITDVPRPWLMTPYHPATGNDPTHGQWSLLNRSRSDAGPWHSSIRPANLNSLVSVTKNKFGRNKCWSVSNVFGPPQYKLFAHKFKKIPQKWINFRFRHGPIRSFAKPARDSPLFPNVFAANSTVSEWRHENSWILISHTSGLLSDKLFTEMARGYRNALPKTYLPLLACTLNS